MYRFLLISSFRTRKGGIFSFHENASHRDVGGSDGPARHTRPGLSSGATRGVCDMLP